MGLTTAKIEDIWTNLTGNNYDFNVTIEEDTVTIMTTGDLKNGLIKYFDWDFLVPESVQPSVQFKAYWDYFVAQNASNYARAYIALTEEYNPLHNYDKYSKITDTKDLHTDTQKNPIVTVTHSGGTTTNTNAVSPYDSADFTDKEKDTMVIPQTTDSTNAYNIETEYGKQVDTVVEETAGNIGVLENTTMITHELDVRKQSIVEYIMNEFCRQYLFLSTSM